MGRQAGEITELQNTAELSWCAFDKALRSKLVNHRKHSKQIDHVCALMRPIFMKQAESFTFLEASMTSEDREQAITDWMRSLLEIAMREMEQYKLRVVAHRHD